MLSFSCDLPASVAPLHYQSSPVAHGIVKCPLCVHFRIWVLFAYSFESTVNSDILLLSHTIFRLVVGTYGISDAASVSEKGGIQNLYCWEHCGSRVWDHCNSL